MQSLVDALSWALLAGGAFFLLTGALGMVRLPDVFTRMHAGGMTDTMGAGMVMAGLAIHSLASGDHWGVPVRLALILGFLWFTSPIATHAVAKAALAGGVRPFTIDGSGDEALAAGDGGAGDGPGSTTKGGASS